MGTYLLAGCVPVLVDVLIDTTGLASVATLVALMLATVATLGGVWAVRTAGKSGR